MKATKAIAATLVVFLAPCIWAQSSNMPTPADRTNASAAPSTPLVEGEVRKIDLATGMIVLRHGDIPNLAMPAMTMGFDVLDRKMLQGLQVGDKVLFQAEAVKGKATVTEIRKR